LNITEVYTKEKKKSGDKKMKNTILLFIFVLFTSTLLFADYRITRGPDIGEIYFIGPTATGEGIYHSTDFGETATCMDSTLNININFMSICADLTPGVIYGFTMPENLFISYDYGQEGSWIFRNSNISYRLNSGVTEGFLYHGFSQHSEDYGFNFIQHSYNGYFGTSSTSEIDINQNIGYVKSYSYPDMDSIYFFISYDNFENLYLQKVFNSYEEPIGSLTRGFYSGELFSFGGDQNELRYSNDYGDSWETKNSFTCPNLPIKGIVGGRQPGEVYMLVEYVQLMHTIQHTYIYHSLDNGETFNVYNPFSFGPEPYFANFEAEPSTGTAPLTVQFTDTSSGINNQIWEWDFDGDGEIDSYEQNPEFTYQEPDTYTVSLTIFWVGQSEMTAWQEIAVIDGSGVDNYKYSITNYELNNYPNPFNPATTISFNLTANDAKSEKIEIYNLKGQKVDQLSIMNYELGVNEVSWNAEEFTSGIYLYKLNAKDSPIKKMILLK